MDDHAHPDVPPVYHGRAHSVTWLTGRFRRRPPTDAVPRVFALLGEDEDGDHGLIAWGMRLPDGSAITVDGGQTLSVGTWSSADRAAKLHHAELNWL
jgi:hypothetical protein